MADKAISELIAASSVTPSDLFVLEQAGAAKKLTGQVLENWLVSFADGHGGIQSIEKVSFAGLVDTYRITLADTTTFDFAVTNGRGVNSVVKTSTSGLVDTYTIEFNDNTKSTFTVTNGEKGDKGDNTYLWIKYASQEPTEESHSFGDLPDDWIGIYFGQLEEAPEDWKEYGWFKIKGEQGDTGDPATIVSQKVEYQVGTSGTIVPSGVWSESIPQVPQSSYLWTRTTVLFNSGDPVVSYSVGRMGVDGLGTVVTVSDVSPDENGNVPLTAENVGALSTMGGTMDGDINMNGNAIQGVSAPTNNTDAANKGYVDAKHATYTATVETGWSGSAAPYSKAVTITGLLATDAPIVDLLPSSTFATAEAQIEAWGYVYRAVTSANTLTLYATDKPTVALPIQIKVVR